MIATLLCVLLANPLSEEAVANGFPILKDQVSDFYMERAKSGGQLDWPRFTGYGKLEQGQVGTLREDMGTDGSIPSSQVWIVQVLDSEKAIAELRGSYNRQGTRIYRDSRGSETALPFPESKQVSVTFLLTGFDLSRVSDGSQFEIRKPLIVDGTHQYATVAGGTNTIPIVHPTEIPEPPGHAVELGIGLRTWKDSTGQFEIEAAYTGYSSGEVELMKKTRETIKVPIGRLGRDEQQFVRDELRTEREKAKAEAAEKRQK